MTVYPAAMKHKVNGIRVKGYSFQAGIRIRGLDLIVWTGNKERCILARDAAVLALHKLIPRLAPVAPHNLPLHWPRGSGARQRNRYLAELNDLITGRSLSGITAQEIPPREVRFRATLPNRIQLFKDRVAALPALPSPVPRPSIRRLEPRITQLETRITQLETRIEQLSPCNSKPSV